MRHLTGSKQLITILNRMGQCCSYEEVVLVDTSLANEILAKSDETGVIIPSNIHPGVFVQMAADNNDINEETIDGKNTTHACLLAQVVWPNASPSDTRKSLSEKKITGFSKKHSGHRRS